MCQEHQNKIKISIKNCNNISSADLDIIKGELNLRYALNGTGKSPLSKAIHARSKGMDLGFLKPFGSDNVPSIELSGDLGEVLIFNEDFVNNTVFNESEVIENGFEVFLKSDDYDQKLESLNQKIETLKKGIEENETFKTLKQGLLSIRNKLKLNSDNVSIKNDPVMKSLTSTENSFRIPSELEDFRPFLENTNLHIDWIDWKNQGEKYDSVSGCPFCTKVLEEPTYTDQKKIFKSIYKKSGAQNLKYMVDLFESLQGFLDDTKYNLIIDLIKRDSDPDTMTQEITKLRVEIEGIIEKFGKLPAFTRLEIKPEQIPAIGEDLESSKIIIERIDYFKSEQSITLFKEINLLIDQLLSIVDDLKKGIGEFKGFVLEKIKIAKDDINQFLQTAGINYKLEIFEEESENIKTILHYVNPNNDMGKVNKIIDHLSWGEKNAFSLVLFMYYSLSRNPNLIILDDPISAFDDNKKYAIINHLFRANTKGKSLYRKSVLMLSHDFEPIIDFIVNTKPTGGFVNAEYLRNNKGFINNYTISKGDVSSWISLLRKYSADSDLCIINRLAFLRKYIELDIENEKQKQKLGYEIISSLQHGYSAPQVKTGGELNDMKEDQIQSGIEYLCEFIGDFNYQTILSDIKSEDKIKSYYESHENNYLKLQVFRAFLEVLGKRDQLNDKHLIKFIDETYHVENDYIYSLDLMKYEIVPENIIESCDKFIFN